MKRNEGKKMRDVYDKYYEKYYHKYVGSVKGLIELTIFRTFKNGRVEKCYSSPFLEGELLALTATPEELADFRNRADKERKEFIILNMKFGAFA